jgi:hypothetical protein
MTDWIKHDGGPQSVADDVWVEVAPFTGGQAEVLRTGFDRNLWRNKLFFRILNQHLIDAKQAEIDALREDLAIWDSVFPDLLPDRLKSDKQLAEEDVAAKIDAARLEGIRLGLEAAAKVVDAEIEDWASESEKLAAIRDLDPETIARLHQLAEEVLASDAWVKGGDE